MNYNDFYWPYYFYPRIPHMNEKPPTVYSLLESIVNFGKDDKKKIKDLAKYGRITFFDFDYVLSSAITREQFETTILNHYLMRRIGFDTLTAFRIQLNVKINEIMPKYNKMFDMISNWNIFQDGGDITKTGTITDNISGTTNNETNNTNETNTELSNSASNTTGTTSDKRRSETPQNQLSDVRDGKYVTDYNYDTNNTTSSDTSASSGTNTSNSSGTNNTTTHENKTNNYQETIRKTQENRMELYIKYQNELNNIFSMIFKELDCLFYGLV